MSADTSVDGTSRDKFQISVLVYQWLCCSHNVSLCKILCDNCSDNTNDVKIFSKGETKNNLNKDNLKT